MTDFRATLAQMNRPRLLIHAARIGLQDYRRERDLRRLGSVSARPDQILPQLLAEELRAEENRKSGLASYSIAHHIDLLIALMAEIRLLPRKAAF